MSFQKFQVSQLYVHIFVRIEQRNSLQPIQHPPYARKYYHTAMVAEWAKASVLNLRRRLRYRVTVTVEEDGLNTTACSPGAFIRQY